MFWYQHKINKNIYIIIKQKEILYKSRFFEKIAKKQLIKKYYLKLSVYQEKIRKNINSKKLYKQKFLIPR